MELIKKSKSHQDVLSQFLQKVMVLDNIPAEQISSVLMTMSPTPTISFHEYELAPKEIKNLPVCVTLLIRGIAVDNVLVDTRASVCVAPIFYAAVASKMPSYLKARSRFQPLITQGGPVLELSR